MLYQKFKNSFLANKPVLTRSLLLVRSWRRSNSVSRPRCTTPFHLRSIAVSLVHTQHTLSLAAQHTVARLGQSPSIPPLFSRVTGPPALCLSKPQLCTVEAVSKRLCGFQRCKGLPTRYNMFRIVSRNISHCPIDILPFITNSMERGSATH